jgi:drug/metabolite transporter (DMT)-like permease
LVFPESRHQSLKADAALVLVTLLASSGWLFSHHALRGLPPLLFLGIRFFSAGLILSAFGGRELAALRGDLPGLRRCLLTGAVLGVAMVCWIFGLHLTTEMGVGAFISSLGVIMAPLVAGALFRARIVRSTWLAAFVASLGMACLALQKGMTVHLADLFFFASALGFSLQFTLNSRFAGRVPVMPLVAIQLMVVGVMALAGALLFEQWPRWIDATTWLWVGMSVLSATCLRFFLQIWAQGRTPLSHAAFIMTLEPIWAALFAAIWLDERMRPIQFFGCLLILLALLISRWRSLPWERKMAPIVAYIVARFSGRFGDPIRRQKRPF